MLEVDTTVVAWHSQISTVQLIEILFRFRPPAIMKIH